MKQVSFDLTSNSAVTLKIDIDYGQFYIIGSESKFDSGSNDFWTKEALGRGLAISPGGIGISSFCKSGVVPVELRLFPSEPKIELDNFVHAVEAGITIEGSELGIGMWHDQWRWGRIAPGKYRIRVYYSGIDSIRDEITDKDYYVIHLWANDQRDIRILKQANNFKIVGEQYRN